MQMLRFALALLGATVALMPGGAYGQYEFEVSSVTDSCDCIKIVATSLYRAGETLDNIIAGTGQGISANLLAYIDPGLGHCVALYGDPACTTTKSLTGDSDFFSNGNKCNSQSAYQTGWGSNVTPDFMLAASAKVPVDFATLAAGVSNMSVPVTFPCASTAAAGGGGTSTSPSPGSVPVVPAGAPIAASSPPVQTQQPSPSPSASPSPSPSPSASTTSAPSAPTTPAPTPSSSGRRHSFSGLRALWLLFLAVLLSLAGLPTPTMAQSGKGIEIFHVLALSCPGSGETGTEVDCIPVPGAGPALAPSPDGEF